MAPQYRGASAFQKRTLLEAFIGTTGYVPKYARWLLNYASEVQQTHGHSHLRRYGPDVVSTVAQICRQTWTKAVSVALGQSGLPVFLPHSSRLSPQVVSSKRCRLEHRPVGPTGAPPLCRVCSFAYGPGLDQRDCPPQPSSIRPVAGQSVFSRSSLGATANETRERSCDAR